MNGFQIWYFALYRWGLHCMQFWVLFGINFLYNYGGTPGKYYCSWGTNFRGFVTDQTSKFGSQRKGDFHYCIYLKPQNQKFKNPQTCVSFLIHEN